MTHPTRKLPAYFLCLLLSGALLAACSHKPTSTADIPRQLSQTYRISVAPFTQPAHPGQMIVGQIPENQGKIPPDALLQLDADLRDALRKDTKRQYNFIIRQNLPKDWSQIHSTGQPAALSRWLEYANKHGAEYLLVPQIMDWHERAGSEAGVTSSAHVRAEFYLINVKSGKVAGRSIFEEKQEGLTDNLLKVGDFVKRGGKWLSSRELAIDGMHRAIEELGL